MIRVPDWIADGRMTTPAQAVCHDWWKRWGGELEWWTRGCGYFANRTRR